MYLKNSTYKVIRRDEITRASDLRTQKLAEHPQMETQTSKYYPSSINEKGETIKIA